MIVWPYRALAPVIHTAPVTQVETLRGGYLVFLNQRSLVSGGSPVLVLVVRDPRVVPQVSPVLGGAGECADASSPAEEPQRDVYVVKGCS
jgi:hypothetical protein